MIEGGVDLIQLRGKQQSLDELVDLASDLHKITCRSSIPLIVNDHAEIARKVPVEGVHVGQEDDSISLAREKTGRAIVIGKSTHNLTQAAGAQHEGADYIGFGPIFATPTKPDYAPIGLTEIAPVHVDVTMPVFCIGGVKIDNAAAIAKAGADTFVAGSAIFGSADYAKTIRAMREQIQMGRP